MFLCWRRDSVWAQVEESAVRVCPLWDDGQEGGGGHTDEAAHHRPLEADQEAGHTTHHQHAHRLPGGPREVGRGDGAQDGQQHHHVTSRHEVNTEADSQAGTALIFGLPTWEVPTVERSL